MKDKLAKLLSLKNVLICISFTVLLLLIKDNMSVVWNILGTITAAISPFLVGFLIAYILNYPYKLFYTTVFKKIGSKNPKLLGLRKTLSIVSTYTLITALAVFLISILVPQIIGNIISLAEAFPAYTKSVIDWIDSIFQWANSTFGTNLDIAAVGNEILKQLQAVDMENVTKFAGGLTSNIWTMLAATGTGVYNFLMGIVISIYFLAAKDNLCRLVKKLAVAFIPIRWLPKIYEIVDITDSKCGRFLVGDIIDAAFLGLLTFAAMSIFQLPYAPLISVIIGVTNIIPFFGPLIGAIPSALILFLEDPMAMIVFIVIIVIIQQLDGNVFKPKIIGNQVGLSSFWVLFSVVIGGAWFGLIGFILGTPVFAVIYSLIRKKANNSIEEKGKIAREALEFEVLNYTKIAEEQKRIRAEREMQQKEKLKKLIPFGKDSKTTEQADLHSNNDKESDESDDKMSNLEAPADTEDSSDSKD